MKKKKKRNNLNGYQNILTSWKPTVGNTLFKNTWIKEKQKQNYKLSRKPRKGDFAGKLMGPKKAVLKGNFVALSNSINE